MTSISAISALVLAAGYSSRMEQFKPLLPLGPMTAVERCIRLFQDAGVQDVRVVVGHRASELKPLLDRLGIRWIANDRFHEGMFSSIQAGIRGLGESVKAFFLLPVDIPLIRRTTVIDLLNTFENNAVGVSVPSFLGRRGHPPLISTKWRDGILSWGGDGGLKAFWAYHGAQPTEVPVADEHILVDMDTAEEYNKILTSFTDYDIPSASESMTLLTGRFRAPERIVAHSCMVAQVALNLTTALNNRGCALNPKLIVASALLHDLAKGKPDHAGEAAAALKQIGYPAVAEVVSSHMDAEALAGLPISPQEVVCFADKMVQADKIVPVEERFRAKLRSCSTDPKLTETIQRRLSNILSIQERLENALGSSVESVISGHISGEGDCLHEGLSLEAR